jgi:hypothetical protein
MDARDRVRTVQVKLSSAREHLKIGEGVEALQEVDEALDIDPHFLAGHLLRESILGWFAERGVSPPSSSSSPASPAGSDGAAELNELLSVQDFAVEPDLRPSNHTTDARSSNPTPIVSAEPFAPRFDLNHSRTPEFATFTTTPAPAWRRALLGVVVAALVAAGAAVLGIEWIGRPQIIVVSPPSIVPVPAASGPPPANNEALAVRGTPHVSPIALAPAANAAPSDDDRLVRLAVERYQLAISARARAHPIESVETWTIGTCVVFVNGDEATAKCPGTISSGPGRAESRVSTFALRRATGGWRIVAVIPGDV